MTVPEGMQAGQTITVMAPDGSRTVKASIPSGLAAGDSFLVRLANPASKGGMHDRNAGATLQPAQPKFANSLDNWLSPANENEIDQLLENDILDRQIVDRQHELAAVRSPSFVDTLTEIFNPSFEPMPTSKISVPQSKATTPQHSREQPRSNQKLLLVEVPPGMTTGQTMHVEVPGENRTLSVQVPANVETFHVSYTPRLQPAQNTTFAQPESITRQQSPTGQKLLLVRVPPGTPANTTLHVSVPDEPGRILAAIVPPGNISEFHVSYEARPVADSDRRNPNTHESRRNTSQQKTSADYVQYGGRNNAHDNGIMDESRDEGYANA